MPNKNKFLCFALVTNELIKKGTENVEHNEFHNVKVPEKLLSQDALYLELGQTVYIEGKIQTTSFVDEMKIKKVQSEIIANKIEVLSPVAVSV